MIEINTHILIFAVLGGILAMEIFKHATAYFWRMLTKTDKHITMQHLVDWCAKCESKKNDKDIITIKKILVKLAIKAGISENEIAELTQ